MHPVEVEKRLNSHSEYPLKFKSVEKIEEAVRVISKYQPGNAFTPKQIDDVSAFFKTLEGNPVEYIKPE